MENTSLCTSKTHSLRAIVSMTGRVCQQLKMSSTWPAAVRFFCSPDKLHMASSSKIFLFFIWAPHDQKQQDFPVLQTSSKWSAGARCFCSPGCPEWLWGSHSLLNEWVWRSLSLFGVKWLGNESNNFTYCWGCEHMKVYFYFTHLHSASINYGQQHSFTSLNISVHTGSSHTNTTANATCFYIFWTNFWLLEKAPFVYVASFSSRCFRTPLHQHEPLHFSGKERLPRIQNSLSHCRLQYNTTQT